MVKVKEIDPAAAQEATQTQPDDSSPPAGHCVLPHSNNCSEQLSHGRNQGVMLPRGGVTLSRFYGSQIHPPGFPSAVWFTPSVAGLNVGAVGNSLVACTEPSAGSRMMNRKKECVRDESSAGAAEDSGFLTCEQNRALSVHFYQVPF